MSTHSHTLLADVGGTNTRIALLDHASNALTSRQSYINHYHPSLEAIVQDYLSQYPKSGIPAVIAIAGPIQDPIQMTNLGWSIDVNRFLQATQLKKVTFVNDFEAIAKGLPRLQDTQLKIIANHGSASQTNSQLLLHPKVVLGPGTGLGVAAVIPSKPNWIPVVTEGGHVTLPATDNDEADLLKIMRQQFEHISAERVLSGPGIVTLYESVATLAGIKVAKLTPKQVTEKAKLQQDKLCEQTMKFFFRFLGSVAGNLALSYGARGGVYLAGGILPKIESLLIQSEYRECFCAKGRFRPYLSNIPSFLVTEETPAMLGLREWAE